MKNPDKLLKDLRSKLKEVMISTNFGFTENRKNNRRKAI